MFLAVYLEMFHGSILQVAWLYSYLFFTYCAFVLQIYVYFFSYEITPVISFLQQPSYVIEEFNPTSRYLTALLNTDNLYFDQLVSQIIISC